MQQQMQKQTRSLFGSFPFPNFAAANPFTKAEPDDAADDAPANPAPKDEGGGNKDGA
jgi:hypothetical protein